MINLRIFPLIMGLFVAEYCYGMSYDQNSTNLTLKALLLNKNETKTFAKDTIALLKETPPQSPNKKIMKERDIPLSPSRKQPTTIKDFQTVSSQHISNICQIIYNNDAYEILLKNDVGPVDFSN